MKLLTIGVAWVSLLCLDLLWPLWRVLLVPLGMPNEAALMFAAIVTNSIANWSSLSKLRLPIYNHPTWEKYYNSILLLLSKSDLFLIFQSGLKFINLLIAILYGIHLFTNKSKEASLLCRSCSFWFCNCFGSSYTASARASFFLYFSNDSQILFTFWQ